MHSSSLSIIFLIRSVKHLLVADPVVCRFDVPRGVLLDGEFSELWVAEDSFSSNVEGEALRILRLE